MKTWWNVLLNGRKYIWTERLVAKSNNNRKTTIQIMMIYLQSVRILDCPCVHKTCSSLKKENNNNTFRLITRRSGLQPNNWNAGPLYYFPVIIKCSNEYVIRGSSAIPLSLVPQNCWKVRTASGRNVLHKDQRFFKADRIQNWNRVCVVLYLDLNRPHTVFAAAQPTFCLCSTHAQTLRLL